MQRKIFFADRSLPSIFAAYRIRRVRGFVARPGRVFCRPEYDLLAALCLQKCPRSINSKRTPEGVGEIEITGAGRLSAAARCVRAGDDAHAEKAELRPAQGGKS